MPKSRTFLSKPCSNFCCVLKMLDLGMLERMSNTSQLPGSLFLIIQTTLGTSRVSLDDIERIEKTNSKYGRWIGFGIGMAMDATAVVLFIDALRAIH